MRRSWAVGLIIISILTMACGGAADVDDYKAALTMVDGHKHMMWVDNS